MPKPSVFVSDDDSNEVLDSMNIHMNPDPAIPSEVLSSHQPLYLDPHLILDGENVRPGETEGEHSSRIRLLAKQIREDGQGVPVIVRRILPLIKKSAAADSSSAYQVVEGQGRVDALRYLSNQYKSEGLDPIPVWCVLTSSDDSWATAVKLNVQRRNYTDLQLADLISQARIKYGWDGKGDGKRLADFFGLTQPHLVEYNTIAAAPADVKARLASGELSKSGALALLKLTSGSEQREAVAEKAKDIATKKAAKAAKEKNGKAAESTPAKPAKEPKEPKQVKVQAKDVADAARAIAESTGGPAPVVKRNRTEIIAAITSLAELMPEALHYKSGIAFLNGILGFADGEFSPKQLQNRWNTLIGIGTGIGTVTDPQKAKKT